MLTYKDIPQEQFDYIFNNYRKFSFAELGKQLGYSNGDIQNILATWRNDNFKMPLPRMKYSDFSESWKTEVLEFLSKDESSLVRRSVATNLKSTEAILDSLSKDEDSYVRVGVAKNPSTSGKILNFLSRDKDDEVRFEVARNESTLSETLAHLASDKHPVIRRNVAINKNTLPETLALLGEERYDFGIKYFVAHNHNTPEEVRDNLKRNLPKGKWATTPSIEMLCNYYDNEEDDWY